MYTVGKINHKIQSTDRQLVLSNLTIMSNQTHGICFRCSTKMVTENTCKHCSRLVATKKIWLGPADFMNTSINLFLDLLHISITIICMYKYVTLVLIQKY